MASVDYHERCGSLVRTSLNDLNGPVTYVPTEQEHPATAAYPNVNVGSCELAAGHAARREMFVDGTGGFAKGWCR